MNTYKLFSLLTISLTISAIAFAQSAKTDTIPVSGNCGMCKSTIEKAAKAAGATSASWDATAKQLTVKYNSSTTNDARIQQSIAAAGYDTRDVKGNDAAYDQLHACCKYERTAKKEADLGAKASCCKKEGEKAAHDASADCCKNDGQKVAAGKDAKQKSCCSKENAPGNSH